MGIAASIFCVLGGIIYVLFKFGTEELGLNKEHGCVFAIAPLAIIFGFGLVCMGLTSALGETDAGLLVNISALMLCIWGLIHKIREEKIENDVHRLDRPVHELVDLLPEPTLERMSALASDIEEKKKKEYYRLKREDAYLESFQRYMNNIDKEPPCAQFKELQAAWLILKRMRENSAKISPKWDLYISAYGEHREYFVITRGSIIMQELDKRLKKRRKKR